MRQILAKMRHSMLLVLGLSFSLTPALARQMDEEQQTKATPAGDLLPQERAEAQQIHYRTVDIDGVEIFYREAGPRNAPTLLLLHGFPSSSHMFRNLIPALAGEYHVIAPDYPGFGYSSAPDVNAFAYTFDHLAEVIDKFTERLGLNHFSLYVHDYGAPIGLRMATQHPERIAALIIQNGNAYDEGLQSDFWLPIKAYWNSRTRANATALLPSFTLKTTKWQYTHGTRSVQSIDPDAWTVDQVLLDRPGNHAIQLALFYSYGSNPPLYPKWQEYFRVHQPPTLIVWGKNDLIFPPTGAEPYKRDLRNIEFHLLDTGHFALEEDGGKIAEYMRVFLRKQGIGPK